MLAVLLAFAVARLGPLPEATIVRAARASAWSAPERELKPERTQVAERGMFVQAKWTEGPGPAVSFVG